MFRIREIVRSMVVLQGTFELWVGLTLSLGIIFGHSVTPTYHWVLDLNR